MLNNIKTKERGFTIVELLIVIVIIAVLAAITILAYNGITNRSKAASAAATANSLQKKLEAYNAGKGSYPSSTTTSDLNDANTADPKVPEAVMGTGVSIGTPTAANGTSTVQLKYCTVPATATGYQIFIWDYNTNALSTNPTVTGGSTGTACTTYGTTAT